MRAHAPSKSATSFEPRARRCDLRGHCTPWLGTLDHLKGIKSAPQWPLANGVVHSLGEPIVAVVATRRDIAEDALDLLEIAFEPLEPQTDPRAALAPGAEPIQPELGDNLCFERSVASGDVDGAFASAAHVVTAAFRFNRHTGVTLEPRSIVCDYDESRQALTLHMSAQCPHMSKNLFAKHLGLDEDKVRVICRDVGGSFGIKIHTYPDEMTAAALSVMLGRPVKFVADRLESFVTDIHARDHDVKARMALDAEGAITAMEFDDITRIGPYSVYPRTSGIEANQVLNLTGGPYSHDAYRARAKVVFQNKANMCQYRGVGHPIAVAIAEHLVDEAGRKLGMDPAELRLKNFIPRTPTHIPRPAARSSNASRTAPAWRSCCRAATMTHCGPNRANFVTGDSIAASGLPALWKSPIRAPPSTASAAPGSHRRTAARSVWIRPAGSPA